MTSPLTGVKVLELTTMITGPLTGMMLGDFGADVIKVERPGDGDPFRSFRGGSYSPHFCAYNRNKRSIALDLTSERGSKIVQRLIQRTDVLIENFRPGVLDRLGFPPQRLIELNPHLVHCHISGFGHDGPYADRPAYDAVAQALGGMSSLFVAPDDPKITGPTIADNVTGQYACSGILAALIERAYTGKPRRIDVNMLESLIAFMPDPFGYYTHLGEISDPYLRARTSQSYAFQCGDEKLMVVHLSSQQKFWDDFIKAIGRADIAAHPELQSRASRIKNYRLIHRLAAETISHQPRSYWLEILVKMDVPVAPIYDVTEVSGDSQVQHLETFFELDHPIMGKQIAIRRPIHFDESRDDQPRSPPPLLGEHTEQILCELGFEGVAPEKSPWGDVPCFKLRLDGAQ